MAVDTSKTIEIGQSPARMLLILGAGVVMTALSLAIALGWVGYREWAWLQRTIGVVGTVFFAFCTVVVLWRLVTVRGPIVTLAPAGIRDTRVAPEFIPWTAITKVSTWQLSRQKVMVLAIDPAVESRMSNTKAAQWTRAANRALGADGLPIAVQGLRIDYGALLELTQAYWAASRTNSAKG